MIETLSTIYKNIYDYLYTNVVAPMPYPYKKLDLLSVHIAKCGDEVCAYCNFTVTTKYMDLEKHIDGTLYINAKDQMRVTTK